MQQVSLSRRHFEGRICISVCFFFLAEIHPALEPSLQCTKHIPHEFQHSTVSPRQQNRDLGILLFPPASSLCLLGDFPSLSLSFPVKLR